METRFSIGNALATAVRVWARNVVPFLILTVLIYAPLVIWGVAVVDGDVTADRWDEHLETFALGSMVLDPLTAIFASAALTYGVVMDLQGQRASLGACIATGLGRFLPALGVVLLTMLACLGGLVLLVVPGVIIFCMLYVAVQVAVVERPGLRGALHRSRALTRGRKLEIFGLLLLLTLGDLAVAGVLDEVLLDRTEPSVAALHRLHYAELAKTVVLGSFHAVVAAVTYAQLRHEREGATASELAAVFE